MKTLERLKAAFEAIDNIDKVEVLREIIQEANNWDGQLDEYCYYILDILDIEI